MRPKNVAKKPFYTFTRHSELMSDPTSYPTSFEYWILILVVNDTRAVIVVARAILERVETTSKVKLFYCACWQ